MANQIRRRGKPLNLMMDLNEVQWPIMLICTLLVGLNKTAIPRVRLSGSPLMAEAYNDTTYWPWYCRRMSL
ncbi:hypothetical protein DRO55_00400 [Candidatus Bathyarchaeota archaeon]|nr:MAG: hypothetical protein DRO55_00400 [Candidatus Bathyarchaeota archaeon]